MHDLLTGDIPALLAVSFGVGIVMGLTGMGGGALMTPALILFGIPPSAAVANDLVAASVNKSVGAAVHWRSGTPHLKLAGWLIAGSVPMALSGAFIIDAIGTSSDQEAFLKNAIGAALLLASMTYLARQLLDLKARRRKQKKVELVVRPIPTLLIGMTGGLLVGLTSVGSGSIMMVALLMLYPALKPKSLVGTDLLQAIPLVMAAAISHVIVTGIDWEILLPLIIGGAPGTFLGARLAGWAPQSVIKRGIILILTLTGLTLLGLPPEFVLVVGAAMVILGPLAWQALASATTRADSS